MNKGLIFRTAATLQLQGLLRMIKPRASVSILCLHRISGEPDYFWQPVYPETFEAMLAYCRKHYSIIPLSRINEPATDKKPRVVFSFDDGYSDFMDAALPLLAKYDAPSNHNIVIDCLENGTKIWTQEVNDVFNFFRKESLTGRLFADDELNVLKGGKTDWLTLYHLTMQRLLAAPLATRLETIKSWKDTYHVLTANYTMMNWQDVYKAATQQVEFGSHTVTHDSLPTLSAEKIRYELGESKRIIESRLDKECDTLALPNGQYNSTVLEEADRAGYKKVLLLNERLHMPGQRPGAQIINRINMVQEPAGFMKLRVELFHRPKNLLQRN